MRQRKPRRTGASSIPHLVTFSALERTPDGGGGFEETWAEKFSAHAEYIHLHGSEAIMEGRMTGRHTQVMRLRATTNTLTIDVTWKAKDETGREFNIRDVTPTEDRAFIDVLAERGVAI